MSVFDSVEMREDSRFNAAITIRPSSLPTIPCPALPANEPTNASSPAPRIRFFPFFPASPTSSAGTTTGFCCTSGVTCPIQSLTSRVWYADDEGFGSSRARRSVWNRIKASCGVSA